MWSHELKLQRAAEHFKKLEAEVRRWEEGDGYALRIEEDAHPPFYVARAELLRPVEEDPFGLLLGDFLQNARSALDYLAGALGDVGAGGVMSDEDAERTQFPIVGDPDPLSAGGGPAVFKKLAKRQLPTVSDPVRTVIEDLQPYNTGGDLWAFEPLWVLHELARFDRHRFLHLGIVRAGGFRLNPTTSRNVRITDLRVETGSYRLLEGIAAEEAAEDIAMFGEARNPDSTTLAYFCAEPINPEEEMHMDFEGALEIVFDADRLPDSMRLLEGDSIVYSRMRLIVPDIEEVFKALSPFLPAEPPEW